MGSDVLQRAVLGALQTNSTARALAFGKVQPADVASCVNEYCKSHLGSPPVQVLFLGISAGFVFGMRLTDERNVVVKFQADTSIEHLNRAYEIQEKLRLRGVPCAKLLSPPCEVRPDIFIVTHSLFAPGRQMRPTAKVRESMAAEYRRIIALADDLDSSGLAATAPMLAKEIFDHFPGLREEIERLWQCGKRVVAHTDWKVRNLLFQDDKVSAVFDFDALCVTSELQTVSSTAMNFMRGRGPITITLYPEETYGFLAAYERFRQQAFSVDEIRQIRLWSLYAMIAQTRLKAYKSVPSAVLAERIKSFDRMLKSIWPMWRE